MRLNRLLHSIPIDLSRPYSEEDMKTWRVSDKGRNTGNNWGELIEPVPNGALKREKAAKRSKRKKETPSKRLFDQSDIGQKNAMKSCSEGQVPPAHRMPGKPLPPQVESDRHDGARRESVQPHRFCRHAARRALATCPLCETLGPPTVLLSVPAPKENKTQSDCSPSGFST